MSSYPAITDITASCDWLTRTFSQNRIRDLVWKDYHDWVGILTKEGHDYQTWQWMGYEGVSIGGASWGHREDGDILRLTSGVAERLFDTFAHYDGNCSRLDVALTVTFAKPIKNLASRAYRDIALLAEPANIRTYSIIENTRGGETLYAGSRSSDQFGRLYDKNAEQGKGEIGQRWRWEVEFKAARAKAALAKLTGSRDRATLYASIVSGFFTPRQIEVPAGISAQEVAIEVDATPTDDEKQIAWLRRQVRPVVERLFRRGRAADVIEALHIEEGANYASNQSDGVQGWGGRQHLPVHYHRPDADRHP